MQARVLGGLAVVVAVVVVGAHATPVSEWVRREAYGATGLQAGNGGDAGAGGFGVAIPVGAVARPAVVGGITLCADGGHPSVVTAVTFRQDDGIHIRAFAVREVHTTGTTLVGALVGTLREAGVTAGSAPVTNPCGARESADLYAELVLEVDATTAPHVTGRDVEVTYDADGRTGTLAVPVTVDLCVGQPGACSPASADPA